MTANRERSSCRPLWRAAAIVVLLTAVVSIRPVWAGDPLDGLSDRLADKTPEEQIDLLRGLLADGTQDARIHFFMGNAWFAAAKYDSAVAQYQLAVDLQEDYSKAWVNMGIAYDTANNRRAARDAYLRAVEINPEDVLAYCHLGFSYHSTGEREKAMDCYQKALGVDPDSAQARYNLGLAFAEARIFKEALREWNRVIELDPDGDLGRLAAENVELIRVYMELGG
jgi:tetratricopeptide (TPR) repeat protein